MIALEKLIAYKGNKYELTKAMIDLARNGKDLLQAEVKHKKEKYTPVVISNVLEGKIKFGYTDERMVIDEHAPFKNSEEVYDETIYSQNDEESGEPFNEASAADDYDYDYDDSDSDLDEEEEEKED